MIKLPRTPKNVLALIIAALIIIFAGSFFISALSPLQTPFVKAGTWISQSFEFFKSKNSLLAEKERLEEVVTSLAVFESELETLRDENANLLLQLNYLQESDLGFVSASITAKTVSPHESVYSLDHGSDHGLLVGQPVIVADGIMVGKISDVSKRTATVRLLSDRSSQTAASILNTERTLGLAEGTSGSLLEFNYIPQNVEILVNDLVVSSGLESNVPPGLVIGIINDVVTTETDPFQTAIIEPLIDFRHYTMVSVITGPTEYE
jgi:rod shape-determining protein MreC